MDNSKMICKKCGAENNSERYFCSDCGEFLFSELLKNKDIPLYRQQIVNTMRISLELDQLDFSRLANITEIELVAVVKGKDKSNLAISESLPIQKCPHVGCGLWGHAREDGYCKYCGRRIRDHVYSYGFQKLELTSIPLKLWDNTEGILVKKREAREHQNGVYSIGQYQDSNHPLANVEILEEKYDSKQEKRFLQFYSFFYLNVQKEQVTNKVLYQLYLYQFHPIILLHLNSCSDNYNQKPIQLIDSYHLEYQ